MYIMTTSENEPWEMVLSKCGSYSIEDGDITLEQIDYCIKYCNDFGWDYNRLKGHMYIPENEEPLREFKTEQELFTAGLEHFIEVLYSNDLGAVIEMIFDEDLGGEDKLSALGTLMRLV